MADLEEIQILNNSSPRFSVEYGNVNYNFFLRWNTLYKKWILDITDNNENEIISGTLCAYNTDLFLGKIFGLGSLFFYDVEKETNVKEITADDLGNRIRIYRYF